jgi:hypothetical protein
LLPASPALCLSAARSFPSLSAHAYKPVFDNIIAQKLLTNNMFSFFYSTVRNLTAHSDLRRDAWWRAAGRGWVDLCRAAPDGSRA